MKAILIARVSTEEQKEAGISLPAQVARLEKYCQNKGFTIGKTFSFDESAYKNQREEFDAILDFVIEQKEKVAVCCDKVDRLSRNIFDKRISVLYEKSLNDQIELHFVSDGQIITSRISAAEKFHFSISLGLAKYYSDAISDNVRRAIEQKLRKGEWPCKAPYGYKNIALPGNKKDIIVDEYGSRIIVKAFELYASGAYSMELLSKKIKADHDLNWSVSYIDKVFNNHFYYGIMLVKDKMYHHRYPPLITQSLFEQVQAVKASFNKKKAKFAVKRHDYIYRGLLRCADCGLAITPEKHKGHVYYHCTQYNGKHGAKWLREEVITKQLAAIFQRMQMPKDVLKQTIETLSEVHENKIEFQNRQFDELTREQKQITKMIDNLYLDKLKGRITESDYDRFYQSFRDQLTDISIRLEQLQEAEDNYYVTVKLLLILASRAYDLFTGSEVEEKRHLITVVLSNLRLDGENIVYDAQNPFDVILKCSEDQVWRP
ncbi:MAG TPA: recombinase family protein [Candidatus Babeliales bacterium]|nr:recombinase family protein [Candidatus Babeliales bacterium]